MICELRLDPVKVTRYTRAPRDGRVIVCPCGWAENVYHFSWSALECTGCGRMVNKYEWSVYS